MSSYPPPPVPGQPPYNSLYHEHPFSVHDQNIDAKNGSSAQAQTSREQQAQENGDHDLHQVLAQGLQQHAPLDDHRHEAPAHPDLSDTTALLATPEHSQAASDNAQKPFRLRKACDSCSIRKVKCDESGPPCRACASLDIPCTFDRPSRRRGPPNRHAEAMKRRKIEGTVVAISPGFSGSPPPSSPHNTFQEAVSSSSLASIRLTADSICPPEILELLIDDFFTYIHPLCPFPHEPSFREAWKRREDLTNPAFLALLASMIGCLTASYPRKPRIYIGAQERYARVPDHTHIVERCQRVCSAARGPLYQTSENLNVHDAVTSFFLARIGMYSSQWRMGRLYLAECLNFLRMLNMHKASGHTVSTPSPLTGLHSASMERIVNRSHDNITLEMGRRVFWATLVSVKLLEEKGLECDELIVSPYAETSSYPELPTEVDDFCIYPSHNDPQPLGFYLPVSTGFNAHVKIHMYCMPISLVDQTPQDWKRQKQILTQCWKTCKQFYEEELGPPWHVYPGIEVDSSGAQFFSNSPQPRLPHDPAQFLSNPTFRSPAAELSDQRRGIMLAVQKADIYMSYVAMRFRLAQKFWSLHEASQTENHPQDASNGVGLVENVHLDNDELEMSEMRDETVTIVLVLLGRMDLVNLEPNGDSFTTRLRCLASNILDIPDGLKSKIALKAQKSIREFLQLLLQLEHVDTTMPITGPGLGQQSRGFPKFQTNGMNGIGAINGVAQNSEVDTRTWQDLRACQEELLRLAESEPHSGVGAASQQSLA